jgi:hypothetical protein
VQTLSPMRAGELSEYGNDAHYVFALGQTIAASA